MGMFNEWGLHLPLRPLAGMPECRRVGSSNTITVSRTEVASQTQLENEVCCTLFQEASLPTRALSILAGPPADGFEARKSSCPTYAGCVRIKRFGFRATMVSISVSVYLDVIDVSQGG